MEILRSADRVPLCVATSWVVATVMPDAGKIYRTMRSMTRTFNHYGIHDYRRRSTRISAAMADATDASRLRLTSSRLILIVESQDVDNRGVPILTTSARFAADRVELLVES